MGEIRAFVAAGPPGVVGLQDGLIADLPQRLAPAEAVAACQSQQQVGHFSALCAGVDLFRPQDGLDDRPPRLGVGEGQQPGGKFAPQSLVFVTRRDEAPRIAIPHVHKDTPAAKATGPCARPVYAGLALAPRCRMQVALFQQPGIEVKPAIDRRTAVIAGHNDRHTVANQRQQFAHLPVQPAVGAGDLVAQTGHLGRVVGRMGCIHGPPEHMLGIVYGKVVGDEQIPLFANQQVADDGRLLVPGVVGAFQKSLRRDEILL